MLIEDFKKSLTLLLHEVYISTPTPEQSWIASSEANSGMLKTVEAISSTQAMMKPVGVSHSIAEHVAHCIFSLDIALQYARGETTQADWEGSWQVGTLTDETWRELIHKLADRVENVTTWITVEESFAKFESVCGFCAAVGHGAYHLGAIRQLVSIVHASQTEEAG